MVKRIVYAVVLAIIGIAAVNDAGRWVVTRYNLTEATNEASRVAAMAADADAAWQTSSNYARSHDVTIYGFDWNEQSATVWTETSVRGTWVLGSVMVAFEGGRLTQDWKIRDSATTPRQPR